MLTAILTSNAQTETRSCLTQAISDAQVCAEEEHAVCRTGAVAYASPAAEHRRHAMSGFPVKQMTPTQACAATTSAILIQGQAAMIGVSVMKAWTSQTV